MADYERELNWDSEIVKDGNDFVLLPEGDYSFRVTAFERGRHNGSAKLPPCSKAIVTLEIDSPQGKAYIKHNLFLHSRCEGLLSNFFTGIGQKKHGAPLKMNWNAVIGSTGRCKIGIRNWTSNRGEDMQSNEVKKFYEPSANSAPAASKPSGGFTPGQF